MDKCRRDVKWIKNLKNKPESAREKEATREWKHQQNSSLKEDTSSSVIFHPSFLTSFLTDKRLLRICCYASLCIFIPCIFKSDYTTIPCCCPPLTLSSCNFSYKVPIEIYVRRPSSSPLRVVSDSQQSGNSNQNVHPMLAARGMKASLFLTTIIIHKVTE